MFHVEQPHTHSTSTSSRTKRGPSTFDLGVPDPRVLAVLVLSSQKRSAAVALLVSSDFTREKFGEKFEENFKPAEVNEKVYIFSF